MMKTFHLLKRYDTPKPVYFHYICVHIIFIYIYTYIYFHNTYACCAYERVIYLLATSLAALSVHTYIVYIDRHTCIYVYTYTNKTVIMHT